MLKEIVSKYFSTLLLILTVIGLGYFAFSLWRDKQSLETKYAELVGTQEKYKQLTLYTAQLETNYRTKEELQRQAEARWKEVSLQKDEQIKLLSDATFLIGKQVSQGKGPDFYFQTPKRTQNLLVDEVRLSGPDSPPVGFVVITSDGTTYKGNYKFEITVHSSQIVNQETGQVHVYAKAYYVALENGLAEKRRTDLKKWKDLEYPLPIVGGEVMVDPVQVSGEQRFYLWAPRIVGGLDVGVSPSGLFTKPMLGVSLMGYGASKRDLDLRILQLGVNGSTDLKALGLTVVPVALRPFKNLLPNTYLGPGIGWDQSNLSYLLNISLGF